MIAELGRARDGSLAVGMIAAVAARGVDDDRRLIALAENFSRHVDLADVDQPARAKLEFQKAVAVGAQRDVVVDAGGHVAEMRRRHVLVHHRLEIEHVERFLGTSNQVIVVARRPHERIGRPLRTRLRRERGKVGAGEQRACGEKLNEAAAAGRLLDDRRHDGSSSPSILPRILSGRRGDGNRRHCIARVETAIIHGRLEGTVTMPNGKPTIAFIGFGEAGQAIAAGLREAGVETMAAWDILFPQGAGLKLKQAAQAAGVRCANSAADAVRGVDLIVSAVTAASSVEAAQAVKAHLTGTPYFLDINSVSPGRKQDTAKLLGEAGRYVDVAVLAPIYPARHQTPLLLAGPHAGAIAPL